MAEGRVASPSLRAQAAVGVLDCLRVASLRER